MIEFRMPSLGADMEDGVFVEWRVAPGQRVERGQVVCVVETQKGAIEVELWDAGTVAQLIAAPGQRIPVGRAMARVATGDEDWQAVAASAASPAPVAAAGGAPSSGGPAPALAARPAVQPAAGPAAAQTRSRTGLPPRASPAARRRAAELDVDLDALAAVTGDAPISVADVERAAAVSAATVSPAAVSPAMMPTAMPPATPPAPPSAASLTPAAPAAGAGAAESMRAAISAAMARSKREIPHYYLGSEVDVEHAQQWLERFNQTQPLAGRVLFAAVALRAIGRALREVPDLNGRFVDGRLQRSEAIHIGVVTSLRGGGIVVPTLHDADRLELPELMAALRDGLARARSGRLRSSDLADSTVTVTNLGDLGVETVYGVIYPPQVALIGLGRVVTRPVVRDGAIVAARTMNVTLSGDHRATDGLTGARFLAALRERLEHPEMP
ncbi:MAG: 2-oxo acid dehydrogenase subunit E2 [Burkholderiaceae bacterium]|nr:2-oxo acid dehydrogenase subunit E2 [Burkholderiaceae bacterium]